MFKISHYSDEIGSVWWSYFFPSNKQIDFFFSSFHSFHREVTKQALFTEKPSFQSLPRLNAPRNKPNFSCCNWVPHRTGDAVRPAAQQLIARQRDISSTGNKPHNQWSASGSAEQLMDFWKADQWLELSFTKFTQCFRLRFSLCRLPAAHFMNSQSSLCPMWLN